VGECCLGVKLRHAHACCRPYHHSQSFCTCEINTTFYGLPSEQTIESWKSSVRGRADFRFVLKMRKAGAGAFVMRQGLTHRRWLA
jgi:uncharacterized protein YecE (DUF72 family)